MRTWWWPVPPKAPPVRRAGLERDLDGPRARHLSLARATRVRDLLAVEARIDAARIEVAGCESSEPIDGRAATIARRGLEIRRDRDAASVRRGRPADRGRGRPTLDFGSDRLA